MPENEALERFLAEVFSLDPEESSLSQLTFPTMEIKVEILNEINQGVEELPPLVEIIEAIVDGHPHAEFQDGSKLTTKSQRDYRIEQSLRFLTGRSQPTRTRDPMADRLLEIAANYLGIISQSGKQPKLDAVITQHLVAKGIEIDADNRSNHLTPIRRAFNKNRRTLLIRAATQGFVERQLQSRNIIRIISHLKALGIKCASQRHMNWEKDGDYGGNR